MKTVKQYVIDAIAAYDNTIDVTDSSVLGDLLVNPGTSMLEPVIAQLNFILNNLGMLDPENIYPTELDQIGSSFLIPRAQGSKSTGIVELFYNTPINLEIPVGTKFTAVTGDVFVTEKAIYISQSEMAQNVWNYPKYSTGSITVVAQDFGSKTQLSPNKITSTNLTPAPVQVTNPTGFSGGSDVETNTAYVQRIINEVISGALGSAASIETTLRKQFPTIQNISVRGMGDSEMLRDLVVSGINVYGLRNNLDFYGKVSGLNDDPYPESRAYFTVFYDDPSTSGIVPDLPTLSEITIDEFTTEQYAGLYKLNDAEFAKIKTLVVFSEDFGQATLPAGWTGSDAKVAVGQLLHPTEISIVDRNGSNKLQLGTTTGLTPTVRNITVPIEYVYHVINYLRIVALHMDPQVVLQEIPSVRSYQDLVNLIGRL